MQNPQLENFLLTFLIMPTYYHLNQILFELFLFSS